MADKGPIGSSGYTAITDLAMADGTPPAEGTLNDMLNIKEPGPANIATHNFNIGGLTLG